MIESFEIPGEAPTLNGQVRQQRTVLWTNLHKERVHSLRVFKGEVIAAIQEWQCFITDLAADGQDLWAHVGWLWRYQIAWAGMVMSVVPPVPVESSATVETTSVCGLGTLDSTSVVQDLRNQVDTIVVCETDLVDGILDLIWQAEEWEDLALWGRLLFGDFDFL